VEKGQLVAELNNTSILQKIETQQYTLDSLNLQIVQQLNYIETQQQRIDTLALLAETDPSYGTRLTSARQTLESRNAQLEMLYAQLSVERNVLKELEEDLKDRQLYAGISGTVSYTLDMGDSTVYTRNQLICTIQNLGDAHYVGFFPEGFITLGQTITLKNGDIEREVTAVSIAPPDVNGNCSVRFSLVVPDATLKAGDSARITMVTQHLTDVLYLPSSSIHTRQDGAFVYYINEAGLIAAKSIVIGPTINGCTQIISGLSEGETILAKLP
jgi:macrolide-specific efflux system membrane fusion protein